MPARLAALAFAFAFTVTLPACREKPAPAGASGDAPGVHRYTVRGEVVRVEGSGPDAQVWIRHEAMPDFVDRDGKRVGMASMVMPFGMAPGVSSPALTPGAKVRFRLVVDWNRNAFAVESVEPLPGDTPLELGKR